MNSRTIGNAHSNWSKSPHSLLWQIRLLTSSRAERHYGTAQSSHAISLTIVFCNKRLSRYSIRPGNSKKVYQLIYCPWANYVWLPDYMSDQHLTLVKCRNDTESYLTWLRILGAHVPLVTLRQAGSTNPMEPHRRNSMGRKPAEPLVDPRDLIKEEVAMHNYPLKSRN